MTLLRDVLWRRADEPSLEHARFMAFSEGYMINGRVLALVNHAPVEIHYAIHCGHDWRTRHVHVHVVQGVSVRRVQLRVDESGRWSIDDVVHPDLSGVADVDLAFTPATNTLPIRRLSLAAGESRDVDAAWVRFPELTCERLPQRYSRLGEREYRYESDSGAFQAHLAVDEEGVVTQYGDLWQRVAS